MGRFWKFKKAEGSCENPFPGKYEYFLELYIEAGILPLGSDSQAIKKMGVLIGNFEKP